MFASAYLACCLASPLIWGGPAGGDKSGGWRLKGTEILLELCGENKQFPHGIYALDPFTSNPKPHLLLRGGRRPVWSPKRNFVAYLKDDLLWVSDRNGNAHWLWDAFLSNYSFHDPPLVWTWNEGFFLVLRLSSWGGLTIYGLREPPKMGEDWVLLPAHIIPLKRRIPLKTVPGTNEPIPKYEEVQWDDLLCFNNPTRSPDGKFVAAEVYPAGPEDLQRAKSKILVYDDSFDPKEMELGWEYNGQTFRGKGKRLTNLGEDVTELRPLWSPTGEWIAFTVVHWKEGYVAPAVIRPDGSDYTELLTKHAPYASISLGANWEPVVPLDLSRRLDIIPSGEWGRPHVWAVEWSEDGKYLLLNMGKRYMNLQVAKWDGKNWWVTGVGGRMSSGFGGLKFVAFGVGGRIAVVPDMTPGIGELWIIEINPDDIKKSSWKTIWMQEGVWIEWMDW